MNRPTLREAVKAQQDLTPSPLKAQLNDWAAANTSTMLLYAKNDEQAKKLYLACRDIIVRNPRLIECSFDSLKSCMLKSFELGLFPGPLHQECAYVPRKNGKTGQLEANFEPMYQGLIKLMRKSGAKRLVARVVKEGDYFVYHEGKKEPEFIPAAVYGEEAGKAKFAYAAVLTADGLWQVEVMNPAQIEGIRKMSRASNQPDSPWNSPNEDIVHAMWAKTVLKRVAKWVNKSEELNKALELDDIATNDTPSPRPLINIPETEALEAEDTDTRPETTLEEVIATNLTSVTPPTPGG